jgi:hypothetical protein
MSVRTVALPDTGNLATTLMSNVLYLYLSKHQKMPLKPSKETIAMAVGGKQIQHLGSLRNGINLKFWHGWDLWIYPLIVPCLSIPIILSVQDLSELKAVMDVEHKCVQLGKESRGDKLVIPLITGPKIDMTETRSPYVIFPRERSRRVVSVWDVELDRKAVPRHSDATDKRIRKLELSPVRKLRPLVQESVVLPLPLKSASNEDGLTSAALVRPPAKGFLLRNRLPTKGSAPTGRAENLESYNKRHGITLSAAGLQGPPDHQKRDRSAPHLSGELSIHSTCGTSKGSEIDPIPRPTVYEKKEVNLLPARLIETALARTAEKVGPTKLTLDQWIGARRVNEMHQPTVVDHSERQSPTEDTDSETVHRTWPKLYNAPGEEHALLEQTIVPGDENALLDKTDIFHISRPVDERTEPASAVNESLRGSGPGTLNKDKKDKSEFTAPELVTCSEKQGQQERDEGTHLNYFFLPQLELKTRVVLHPKLKASADPLSELRARAASLLVQNAQTKKPEVVPQLARNCESAFASLSKGAIERELRFLHKFEEPRLKLVIAGGYAQKGDTGLLKFVPYSSEVCLPLEHVTRFINSIRIENINALELIFKYHIFCSFQAAEYLAFGAINECQDISFLLPPHLCDANNQNNCATGLPSLRKGGIESMLDCPYRCAYHDICLVTGEDTAIYSLSCKRGRIHICAPTGIRPLTIPVNECPAKSKHRLSPPGFPHPNAFPMYLPPGISNSDRLCFRSKRRRYIDESSNSD